MMQALAERQAEIGKAIDALVIETTSTSPFATGLGWEHPNENGFAFLQPYGLPYLAGSGVKGVVRQAARQLAGEDGAGRRGWNPEAVETLFGPPSERDDGKRGALRFFDVVPELGGNIMTVDIVNPHYGDYYQRKSTPHDAGSPIPIFFLVVPAGSKFTFIVDCPHERKLPENVSTCWRELVRAAFDYAFDWLGFGAKTAVGYGAMTLASGSVTKATISSPAAEAEQKVTGDAPAREAATFTTDEEIWEKATLIWNAGGGGVITAVAGPKRAELRGPAAQNFLATLSEPQRKQLVERKKELTNVCAVVEVTGNLKILKRLG